MDPAMEHGANASCARPLCSSSSAATRKKDGRRSSERLNAPARHDGNGGLSRFISRFINHGEVDKDNPSIDNTLAHCQARQPVCFDQRQNEKPLIPPEAPSSPEWRATGVSLGDGGGG